MTFEVELVPVNGKVGFTVTGGQQSGNVGYDPVVRVGEVRGEPALSSGIEPQDRYGHVTPAHALYCLEQRLGFSEKGGAGWERSGGDLGAGCGVVLPRFLKFCWIMLTQAALRHAQHSLPHPC